MTMEGTAKPTTATSLLVLVITIAISRDGMRTSTLGRPINTATLLSLPDPSIVIPVVVDMDGLVVHRYVPLFGTVWLLVIAIGTRYVATAHRITENAFRQLNPEMAEYARTAGVTSGRTLFSIAIPAARTGLI